MTVGSALKGAGKKLQQGGHDTAQKLREGGKHAAVLMATTTATTITSNSRKQAAAVAGYQQQQQQQVALENDLDAKQPQEASDASYAAVLDKLKHNKVVEGLKHATDKVFDGAGKAVSRHMQPKGGNKDREVDIMEEGEQVSAVTTAATAVVEKTPDENITATITPTTETVTGAMLDRLTQNKVVDGIKHTTDKITSTTMSVGKTVLVNPVKSLTTVAPPTVEQTEDDAIIEVKPPANETLADEVSTTTTTTTAATVGTDLLDKLTHNKVVDGIKHTTDKISSTTKTVGRTMLVDPIQSLTHYKKKDRGIEDPEEQQVGDLPPVPPDETLNKMDIILTKRIKGLTVQQFYDTIWKEDPPLYKPWLEASGKNDIDVQEWQTNDGGPPYTGTWDGEEYDQQRTVTFRFTRTTHLYTGPPVADVKHTQYCRLVPDERCVLSMTIEMQGIPFADCFNVQIRWVSTRLGSNNTDLRVQVGLHVNFIQQTILAGKIRSGTSEETTKTQRSLLETVKEACAAVSGGEDVNDDYLDDDDEDVNLPPCWNQFVWLQNLFLGSKMRSDVVSQQTEAAQAKLQRIQLAWNNKSDHERSSTTVMIESELTNVHASLDKILQEIGHGAKRNK